MQALCKQFASATSQLAARGARAPAEAQPSAARGPEVGLAGRAARARLQCHRAPKGSQKGSEQEVASERPVTAKVTRKATLCLDPPVRIPLLGDGDRGCGRCCLAGCRCLSAPSPHPAPVLWLGSSAPAAPSQTRPTPARPSRTRDARALVSNKASSQSTLEPSGGHHSSQDLSRLSLDASGVSSGEAPRGPVRIHSRVRIASALSATGAPRRRRPGWAGRRLPAAGPWLSQGRTCSLPPSLFA